MENWPNSRVSVCVRCATTKSKHFCILYSIRSERGQRLYSASAVARVRLIQQLYAAGLPSKALRELLACIETPIEKYTPLLRDRLISERDRIDGQIAELIQTRVRLDDVINKATA